MQYLLLIYENEQIAAKMSPAERSKFHDDYMKFTQEQRAAGHVLGGEALQAVRTATTVRVREGKVLTTDGPFAETREQLGGYYVIEARDLDEARAIAAKIPSAVHGSIELRPIMKFT